MTIDYPIPKDLSDFFKLDFISNYEPVQITERDLIELAKREVKQ